ncbi:MAG: OmpA family protein [Bacteroidetes bacterium]|nr:OmpA family protein [Bacteroidota bacterium]
MKTQTSIILVFLLSFTSSLLFGQDIAGSTDHPIITRYPNSEIKYYEVQKYQKYYIATGPETGYKQIDKWVEVEGKFTRIYYVVTGETTLTEVYRNYKSALAKGGFNFLAEGSNPVSGVSKEVGGRGFLNTFYSKNPFPTNAGIKINTGSSSSAGACYIAAKLTKQGSNFYVIVGGSQYTSSEKVFIVDIIEETIMEDDLIQVNAEKMLKDLNEFGKATLYGIYFDFDKTEIKEESKVTLDEISKLLKSNSSLNIYVVGHTDMKGAFEYNLTLSKNRAKAIVNELVKNYAISANRLSADGVGPLAPVSTNQSEEGRKLNRRVELVLK